MARIAASVSAYAVSKTRFASGKSFIASSELHRSSAASAGPLGIAHGIVAELLQRLQGGCARVRSQDPETVSILTSEVTLWPVRPGSSSAVSSAGLDADLAITQLHLVSVRLEANFYTSLNITIPIFVNFSNTLR